MPRNVRNFWLEARIDGRDRNLAGGPRAKDGGMDAQLFVRDCGQVRGALEVLARERNGTLRVTLHVSSSLVHKVETTPDGGTTITLEVLR